MKNLIYICFLFPLVTELLNARAFIIRFISPFGGVNLNYFNLSLVCLGTILLIKKKGVLSKTAKLWFAFYLFYFNFGILAIVLFSNYTPLFRTFIPLLYFTGFYFFLSVEKNRDLFFKTTTYGFLAACILLIIFVQLNFDLDKKSITLWKVDRPGGVYGDANNAALACILGFVFLNKYFIAETKFRKYIKTIIKLIFFYGLFITFSTTGMLCFIIILFINNLNFFSRERIIIFFIAAVMLITTVVNLNTLTSGLDLTTGQRSKIDTLVNIVSLNTDKIDSSGRGELIENILKYIYKNPFIGNGIDFSIKHHTHNTYFGVWVDAGIFTFIVFIILLITYFVKSIKADVKVRYFCLSIMIALCVFMMSLHTVINQPYLIVLIPYVGYLIDTNQSTKNIFNQ